MYFALICGLGLVSALGVPIEYIPSSGIPPDKRILPVIGFALNELVVYSGFSGNLDRNLWTYSFGNNSWAAYGPLDSNYPVSRSQAGGFVSMSYKFYIFGGLTGSGILNDLWVYDLSTQQWIELESSNPPPPLRSFAYTNYIDASGNEYFMVYSGVGISGFNDKLYSYFLFRLDVKTLKWKVFINNGTVPQGADGGTIEVYKGFVYYLGQFDFTGGIYKGIYKYDLNKQTWQFAYVEGGFEGRKLHQTALVNNYLYVLFGRSIETGKNLPDVIRVDLDKPALVWETVLINQEYARDSFSAEVNGLNICLFGGFVQIKEDFSNQLLVLNTKNGSLNLISNHYEAPQSRYYHSMHFISGKFYLFGGTDSETIYNDLWEFDPVQITWTSVQTIGSIPTARFAFAAKSEGDALALWGGEGYMGLTNDLYLYNSLTKTWEVLTPNSLAIPNPARGACLVLSIPYIYIYGGETSSGFSGNFWVFNLWTMEYSKLPSDIPVSYADCSIQNGFFYLIFGERPSSTVQSKIRKYEFSSETWSDYYSIQNLSFASNQGAVVFINGNIVKIGGQIWNQLSDNNIYYFSKDQKEKYIGSIPEYPYKAAHVYYGSYIYIYGGSSVVGKNLRISVPSNKLYKISMADILGKNVECSQGFQASLDGCEICPAGSYNDGVNNLDCLKCVPGTYNMNNGSTSTRQCYPCKNNFYNPYEGATYCLDCPTGYSCPPGSSGPSDVLIKNSKTSIQPDLYVIESIGIDIFKLELGVGLAFLFIILVILAFDRTRDILKDIDIYTDLHNFVINEPMFLKETRAGGVSTLVFICLAIILVGTTFLNYTGDNIQEDKGLVPKVVLDLEVESYIASSLTVIVELVRYGDSCNYKKIQMNMTEIDYKNSTMSAYKTDQDSCVLTFVFSSCTLNPGSKIAVTSNEKLSFCSGININVTSSSSIPGQISSILSSVFPNDNFMFIGTAPSQFFYIMTPSLFESDSNLWPSRETGFHVSSETIPIAGSQYQSQDLSIISQLKIEVFLDVSISALRTKRYYKQSLEFILSSLIGSIFGIMNSVGGIMKFVEKHLKNFSRLFKKKVKKDKIKEKRKEMKGEFFDNNRAVATNPEDFSLRNSEKSESNRLVE